MVKDIVGGLEKRFADIGTKMQASPGLDASWKSEALNNTLREIPRIPISGAESGRFTGFGKHLYVKAEDLDFSKTVRPLH